MLLASGDTEQWVDRDLQHGHSGTDHEIGDDRDAIFREESKTECAERPSKKGQYHHGFFREPLDEKTGGDGHHGIGNEEREGEKSRCCEAHVKAMDNIGDERPDNICEQ